MMHSMGGFRVLLFVVLVAATATLAAERYTDKYDSLDIDAILGNERLYQKYLQCLKGGRCTPDGKELKEVLPDALKTGCSKCSEKQRQGVAKVMKFMTEKKPKDLADLEKIYDPTGSYRKQYQEEAKKLGIANK
ncbi:hypothetical protein AAG570_012183 [Ranatra chinensis]|uniref:Uncharacterized protein n=1 Tax=Ranatra chinensis TaxID=642074 RepID=A0ABD0YWJ4_9HEMI